MSARGPSKLARAYAGWRLLRRSRAKLAELDALPEGLRVVHSPHVVLARGTGPEIYTWNYHTEVTALGEPVTIEEFGAFALLRSHWIFANFTGESFTRQEFADWYGCPDGVVRPEAPCADPANWSRARDLRDKASRWYFIGTTPSGRRVKGEAIVTELGQLA